jgi:predicted HAD superfamily Cof-like phosphohydrolase
MRKIQRNVTEFHLAFGHPIGTRPGMLPADRVFNRAKWIEEEARELRDATTMTEQADAFIDAIYFAVGGLVEMGIDGKAVWDLVHGANMAKLGPDGKPIKDPVTSKVIKPEGWCAPDAAIATMLGDEAWWEKG